LVVLVCVSGYCSALSVTCGTYGPKEYINIGTTLEATALFSCPLAAISSGPYLLGCTPSQATLQSSNTSEYIVYSYVAGGFFVSTAHWYKSGSQQGTVTNQYENASHPFIGSSYFSFTSRNTFVNVSFQYNYKLLDSVSVYSPNINAEYEAVKKSPIGLNNINHVASEPHNPEPDTPYNSFTVYDYGDNSLPNQATNISNKNNLQGTSLTYNVFTTDSTGKWIVRIVQTIATQNGQQTNKRYVYYNSDMSQVTKICAVSCINYSYDSMGRLTTVTENGETLESYKYVSGSGPSRLASANLGTYGTWTFTY